MFTTKPSLAKPPKTRHPTPRQLRDKRFLTTESKIRLAFTLIKDAFSVSRLAKLAGVSRSTLNRHHGNIHNIIPDYEDYIIRKYGLVIRRLNKIERIHLRSLYERTFIFMISYRRIMVFLLEHGSRDFLERFLTTLEPKTLSAHKITNHEMFIIYSKEVAAIIEQWERAGFAKDEIPAALDKIMYLTNTAHHHLSPVVGK